MFLRFVSLKYKSGMFPELERLYNESILPQLQKTKGCLHASLMKSSQQVDECNSMTLWDSLEHVREYEQGGIYEKLLDEVKPYLSDSSEWKIQLTKEMNLEVQQIPDEPVIKSYSLLAESNGQLDSLKSDRMHLRFVSHKLKPGKLEEFRQIYIEDIIPALQEIKGCRHAYLTENLEEKNEVISVTIWDSKEDAEYYETSGRFNELVEKLQHTFSELFQWKMALEAESGGQVMTSEDLTIDHYNVVAGKSFG